MKVSDRIARYMNKILCVNFICLRSIVDTSSIGGSVGIYYLRHWIVCLVICEATFIPATVATNASFNTVHKLLHGKLVKFASLKIPGTF